jgi:hypothetical protein
MKIFGIGLSRTASVTLNEALIMLGYRSHFVIDGEEDLQGELAEFDAFTHMPIAVKFKEMDERFPGSKFILSVRKDREAWLNSCEKRIGMVVNKTDAMKKVLKRTYGTDVYDREMFNAAYEQHFENVIEHFKDRKDDLLIIDITCGEGFEKLCPFLGKPMINEPLPRKNTMSMLESPSQKCKRFLIKWCKASAIKRFMKKLIGK